MTIPCVKLSDFDILGLNSDIALMTDCQYGGRTLCMVKHQTDHMVRHETDDYIVNKIMDSIHIGRFGNLSCITRVDFSCCYSLCSGHLEQLAIACPNL